MKKELFAAVLAGTMLLAGCANAAPPATVTTVGTSAPTVKPTETVPNTTVPTTAPTTEPVKPTAPDYDEYFSSQPGTRTGALPTPHLCTGKTIS